MTFKLIVDDGSVPVNSPPVCPTTEELEASAEALSLTIGGGVG
jgi:hypothetical protein